MSLKYTPVTKSILCLIFLLHIRTIQRLKYGGQKSIKEFSVSDVNIPVTLKQGQGHQTWYKLVDSKQGYNYVKFGKNLFERCLEKASDLGVVFPNQETS